MVTWPYSIIILPDSIRILWRIRETISKFSSLALKWNPLFTRKPLNPLSAPIHLLPTMVASTQTSGRKRAATTTPKPIASRLRMVKTPLDKNKKKAKDDCSDVDLGLDEEFAFTPIPKRSGLLLRTYLRVLMFIKSSWFWSCDISKDVIRIEAILLPREVIQ